MASSVLKHDKLTIERIEKFISKTYFTDCNLFSKLILHKEELKGLWSVTYDTIVPYNEVKNFKEAKIGDHFGPSWRTVWFKVQLEVPDAWKGHEVGLVWECDGEATVWRDGQPMQGLSVEAARTTYVVYEEFKNQPSNVTLFIEMSCNALFGVGKGSLVAPPDPHRTFKLTQAHLVVFEPYVKQLLIDLDLLWQIAKNLDGQRGKQAMFTANEMINVLRTGHFEKPALLRARQLASSFFGEKNGDSQHTLHAVGNCHLDTAWLWPVRETVRKCCRSFSTTLALMEKYPHFVFVCSQAQQLAWMKDTYPGLFARIQQRVKEGRFKLVGGVWIEMDANLPGGESLIRQFLKGQQFFKQQFDVTCDEFWLPDTFGYSAQLPQIIKGCGMNKFVTQKLSWSFFNKFPHHTFWWHGIDDSRVLVHFPPGDSYSMQVTIPEVLKSVSNSEDQGRTNHSLFLYGFGDGGQGPTEEMLEKIERLKDVDGLPKLRHSDVTTFFEEVSASGSNFAYQRGDGGSGRNEMLCDWKGELFLELHNGTYTTQAEIKRRNREAEGLLHRLETLFCMRIIDGFLEDDKVFSDAKEQLHTLWLDVLLNQFHDILPGSGIGMVYKDAHDLYDDVFRRVEKLLKQLLPPQQDSLKVLNTMAWSRKEVLELETVNDNLPKQPSLQHPGLIFQLLEVESMSVTNVEELKASPSFSPCSIVKLADGSWKMSNEFLSAKVNRSGHVTELFVTSSPSRNALKEGGGNQLVLYDDMPLYWDAWDVMAYHQQTRERQQEVVSEAIVVEDGKLRVALKVVLKIGSKSRLEQIIELDACSPCLKFKTKVDWRESHKLLKVEFSTSVLSRRATYDIQFGCLERPNHSNTTWDMAQYEVCGHKWADLSEEGYGVAVLNDCKYGWSCVDNRLCLSLLRSPKNPDAEADMGVHEFVYAIMPHAGRWQEASVVRAAHNLNNPLYETSTNNLKETLEHPLICLSHPAIVLSAFKPAENDRRSLVVRLFESHGGTCECNLTFGFPVKSVSRCNMLEEEEEEEEEAGKSGSYSVLFKPFQVVTLILKIQ